jgi:FecR protein
VGGINYVEGQAAIDTGTLTSDSVDSVALEKDQTLTTQAGKVEILLTPGIFLRVADNSQVKMISSGLADTEVELQKGRASIEVLDLHKENNIRINQDGASTKLLKNGLYQFDAEIVTKSASLREKLMCL